LDEYKRIKKSEYAKLNALLKRESVPDEALRQNTVQGLAPKAPTKNDTKPQAKAWTDAAVEALKFAAHPREIDEWFNINSRALEKLEAIHDDQYQRIVVAAAEVRETLTARAA
jgi:tryptophan 2,3-dioxygenase